MATPGRSRTSESRTRERAEALAATLPPLLVAAERVAATVAQGVHGRRRVGQGETFWQFRSYQHGDSTQAIDWRQSAKTQRVYVRETEWEAAQSVWLWRDGSASMHYRSHGGVPPKVERADVLLLALAILLVRGGERVALLGSGLPPMIGRTVPGRLAHRLAEAEATPPPAEDLPPVEPLPRDARVVLIGDFLAEPETVRERIAALVGRGVRGHLVQVLDPAEENLPFGGRVRFEGLEGEGGMLIGRVETVREAYTRRLEGHRTALTEIARAAGWTFARHTTDHPPQAALLALYMALATPPGL